MDIKQIGSEMATQNNRSTQYPLFVIQVQRRVYMPHDFGWDYDGKERKDEGIQDLDARWLCQSCCELRADDQDMPDACEDCDDEAFNWYKLENEFDVNAGIFLTAKACQQHIDENHYHYAHPQVYGVSAWRNEEMQTVMRHLIQASGNEIPSHYR